jgi:hypothetical protein
MTIDVETVLRLLAEFAVVIGALAAGVVWLRKWLRKQVAEPLGRVEAEMTPNQGASMKDAVGRIEHKVETLGVRFDDHLTLGHGKQERSGS